VVGVSDFNSQVDLITREVSLGTLNEIQVELRSKPGDFITIVTVNSCTQVPLKEKAQDKIFNFD